MKMEITPSIEAAKDIRVIRASHLRVTASIVRIDDRHTKTPRAIALKPTMCTSLIAKVARDIPAVVDRVGLREIAGGIGEVCQDLERHRRVSLDVSVESEETSCKE